MHHSHTTGSTQRFKYSIVTYFGKQKTSPAEASVHSFAVISYCLEHDTVAVHTFQSTVLGMQKQGLPPLKYSFFSLTSSLQYKNKNNFVNFRYHEKDYKLPGTLNFFASSLEKVNVTASHALFELVLRVSRDRFKVRFAARGPVCRG